MLAFALVAYVLIRSLRQRLAFLAGNKNPGAETCSFRHGPAAPFLYPIHQRAFVTFWWSWSGSNRRPPACKADALPAELQPQAILSLLKEHPWLIESEQRAGKQSLKEVIQPQVPLRLPCYDFTPIIGPTVDGCLPCGLAYRLRVKPTFVV